MSIIWAMFSCNCETGMLIKKVILSTGCFPHALTLSVNLPEATLIEQTQYFG